MIDELVKKIIMIHKLINVDIIFVNSNNEIETSYIRMDYPQIIAKDINLTVSNIIDYMDKQNTMYDINQYSSNFNFLFLSCAVYTGNDSYYGSVILGPIAIQTMDLSKIDKEIKNRSEEEKQVVNTFLSSLDFISLDFYELLYNVIYNTISNEFKEPKVLNNISYNNKVSFDYDYCNDYDVFSQFLEKNFDMENKLLQYVKTGNIKKFKSDKSLLKRNSDYVFKKRATISYIRNLKDICITCNSIALRAALQGGLPNILGYHLSNKNAVLIEKANNISTLLELNDKIMEEYCLYVNQYSNPKYSHLIKKTLSYIFNNLTQQISLNEIAEYLYTNPAYLSRKFKKETGYSITYFINNEKIKQAKLLIQENKYTLTEISCKVGYNNYTHFAQVFKKLTTLTPKEYKQKLHLENQPQTHLSII